MFSLSLRCLAMILAGFASFCDVLSVPIKEMISDDLEHQPSDSIQSDVTPAPPHFVIYGDQYIDGVTGPPSVSQIKGFNVYALSVLLTDGAYDKADEWTQLSSSRRATIKSQYAAAGIKLIVSLFGSTDTPTSNGADPVDTANTMAEWAIKYDVDGVDVDYEDFDAINAQDGTAEAWLATFTTQLRQKLPQGQYILTHAPVAPWFGAGLYQSGAYLTVDKTVGDLIDWYNLQFYNQKSEYSTCATILTKSGGMYPNSSIFEINASGVPLSKLVLGKPGKGDEDDGGYVGPNTLATCLEEGKALGWNAGAMFWEFPDVNSSFIQTVRSLSWPV